MEIQGYFPNITRELYYSGILNSRGYNIMIYLEGFSKFSKASVLLDLMSETLKKPVVYKKFIKLMQSKPALLPSYYKMKFIGKQIT